MDYEPLPDDELERVNLLEGILIGAATSGGGPMDNHTYTELRAALLQNHTLKALVPPFIRTCRDLSTFRSHTQQVDGQWAPRRAYIRQALTPLFDHLEGTNRKPVDAVASDVLLKFDPDGVHAVWQKALDRRHNDPEGAITAARTLLETVCKHILDKAGVAYGEKDDLPALYRATAKQLNIAPSQHTEEIFKQILGGVTAAVEGLGALRNRISDAHGQGAKPVRPQTRHAQLAVNLAGTLATFLIDTWLAKKPYPTTLQGLHMSTDDCIFFSKLLGDDLLEYGKTVAVRLPKRLRGKYAKATFDQPEREGLMPDPAEFPSWTTMFQTAPVLGLGIWTAEFEALALAQL